jgi:hypothetical protein
MPTLAEIMAAKEAKRAAAKPPEATGIKITPESEQVARAAEIKQSLDACAPKAKPPAPRELGALQPGERVPMDHPGQGAAEDEWKWFDLMHSFATDLGIVIDPNGEQAWIAVKARRFDPPLLLHPLPIINRKRREADPF